MRPWTAVSAGCWGSGALPGVTGCRLAGIAPDAGGLEDTTLAVGAGLGVLDTTETGGFAWGETGLSDGEVGPAVETVVGPAVGEVAGCVATGLTPS